MLAKAALEESERFEREIEAMITPELKTFKFYVNSEKHVNSRKLVTQRMDWLARYRTNPNHRVNQIIHRVPKVLVLRVAEHLTKNRATERTGTVGRRRIIGTGSGTTIITLNFGNHPELRESKVWQPYLCS